MATLWRILSVTVALTVGSPGGTAGPGAASAHPHVCTWCTVALDRPVPFANDAPARNPPRLVSREAESSAAEYTAFFGALTGFIIALRLVVYQPDDGIVNRRLLMGSALGALGGFAVGKLVDAIPSGTANDTANGDFTPD